MQARSIHLPSVLIGALGILVIGMSMSQASPPSTSWGPPKKSIVNYYEPTAPGGSTLIPPGATVILFSVPTDRWLTITKALGVGGNLELAEEIGGVLDRKGPTQLAGVGEMPDSGGGPLGLVFRPGSNVVIHNPSTGNGYVYQRAFIGYLSRD